MGSATSPTEVSISRSNSGELQESGLRGISAFQARCALSEEAKDSQSRERKVLQDIFPECSGATLDPELDPLPAENPLMKIKVVEVLELNQVVGS